MMGDQGMGPGAMPGGEMMGPEMMHMMRSMMGQHHGPRHMARRSWTPAELDLEPEDVRRIVDGELARRGLKLLKVGNVDAGDDDTMIAEIVTPDDSLAFRLSVDRQSGDMTVVD